MKNTLPILAGLALFLLITSPAFAHTRTRVVTAPYWCGTYYSSYPCTYQSYAPTYYDTYQSPYYYNYSSPYYGYIYPPLASAQNGYCPQDYYYSEGGCYPENYGPYTSYGNYTYPYDNGYYNENDYPTY